MGALPTIAFSGILLLRYADSERARAERVLIESTRGLARGIDAHFIAAEAALLALRDSESLDIDDLVSFERRLRRTAMTTGRAFALFDANGRQIINTFLPEGMSPPDNPIERWASVFKERRTVVTNVFRGGTSQRLLAGIAVPVIKDGSVKWALAAGLFDKDFDSIIRQPGVPSDWIVSIVDRSGQHMARSRNNDQFAGKPLVQDLINFMQRNDTGTIRTVSLEGIELISTVQIAPVSGWAAAVGLPVASLEKPMLASLNQLLLLGILIAGIALLLAFSLARLLDRSMLSLTTVATELGRGKAIAAPHSVVKDINVVGDVLAKASNELQSMTESLEAKVAARTAEILEANAKLKEEMKRRQDSEAQLIQMQKIDAIGKLTGGIAHDFNNMLAIVLSSLGLIQRRLRQGDTNVERFIDSAMNGAERAANLTKRLLAFSRQQPLAPKVIDGNRLILTTSEMLRRTIPESIRIETALAGGLWQTFADIPGLENVIINLAVNSRDAMPDGGRLTIETANVFLDEAYAATNPDVKSGQYVMIAITDSGAGISADVIARVFDPFFTTKPPGQGTGLGLSQVHGFIKQSGGHVAIYSEPGQGTTVKLYLPRYFGDGVAAGLDAQRPASLPKSRHGELVLVVEDEPEVRKLTIEMIRELGYATCDADSGEAALEVIESRPEIALVVTDVVMPGMNGRMLANAILTKRPGMPVLFTTGYTRNAIVHHGILDPDVHVAIKPFSLEILAAKLAELLYGIAPR